MQVPYSKYSMTSIVAGVDVSGDPDSGNYKFMGIVMGTRKKIDSVFGYLESDHIHMSMIKNKKTQDEIVSMLKFDDREITAFCIRLDKVEIINTIQNMRKIKSKNVSGRKIIEMYNRLLLRYTRDRIEEFPSKHGYALSEVVFQSDSDCMNFLKDNGLRHSGVAHILSDIVAWANNKSKEPEGAIQINPTDKIQERLKWEIMNK